jgi:cytochrome d ubiquinol oxidase subunit I
VRGLNDFPQDEWPPISIVHASFQLMVALGTAMAVVSLWAVWTTWRHRTLVDRRHLLAVIAAVAPFGFVATEAGWVVTEVGRQPWVVQGVIRTADAVTPMPGLWIPFGVFVGLYVGLAAIVILLIVALVRETAVATS